MTRFLCNKNFHNSSKYIGSQRNEKETVLNIPNSLLSSDGNHMYFRSVFSNFAHAILKLIEEKRYIYPLQPTSTW